LTHVATRVYQEVEFTNPDHEEMATFYASIAPDGPQLGNPKTAELFNTNFMKDFRALLGDDHVIKVRDSDSSSVLDAISKVARAADCIVDACGVCLGIQR
jgi:hypothetical protein